MNTLCTEDTEEFAKLGLKSELLQALKKAGFHTPSPIQQEVIPLILEGRDVIGHAQTGTGKTAAFALPALHLLRDVGQVEILVVTPTRELASQVSEEISRLGSFLKTKTATVYGGKSFQAQIDAIRRGAHVVIATPGRLLDLLQGGKIAPFSPSIVIIDEADEMLDMGFLEDLQAIFEFLPKNRQTLMFSATMPPAIQALAKKILHNPAIIKAAQTQATNEDITQHFCLLQDHERDEATLRLFASHELQKSIIFCRTKKEVDRLSQVLSQRGHKALSLHGDMEQSQREHVTHAFRVGHCKALIATDVAARGLNIVDVSHVINYHIPFDPENYVHRIGRTGRAGRKGTSITFVTPKEYGKLLHFQRIIGGKLERFHLPSKKQVEQVQLERLLTELQAQSMQDKEAEALAFAQTRMDTDVLAHKLLAWALSRNPTEGPEHIGIAELPPKGAPRRSGPSSYQKRPHQGRSYRTEPNAFGSYPKKKFNHPRESHKPKKKW